MTEFRRVLFRSVALHGDSAATYAAMARIIDAAEHRVHVEFYIQSWDEVTDVFYSALARAAARGVTVRLLVDHLGSRKYPGWRRLGRRFSEAGIQWRLMMPLLPLRRRFRQPDLAQPPQDSHRRRPARLHRLAQHHRPHLQAALQCQGGPGLAGPERGGDRGDREQRDRKSVV